MLRALRKLGELLGTPTLYDPIKADKVLVIEFDSQGNYKGVSVEPYKEENVPLYLYRYEIVQKNLTPTLTLSRKKFSNSKELRKSLRKSVENIIKAYNNLKNRENIPTLNFEEGKIINDIMSKIEEFDKNDTYILTVRIDGKFIGEIESFKKALKGFLDSKVFKKENGENNWVDGICAICGRRTKVNGNISPFKFYTIDKPGYVIGLNKQYAYKSFPLCEDCRSYIRLGRQHVENNLKFKLVSKTKIEYYLIPDFILGPQNVREEVLKILTTSRKNLISLRRDVVNRITDDADEILEILSEERDVMSFHFLFMQKSNNAERILLYIQDVYPSRLKRLFEVKKYIDEKLRYEGNKRSSFTYATIGKFFKTKDDLYDVVYRTFTGRPIDMSWVIHHLMGKIREDLLKPKSFYRTVTDAFATFIFVAATTEKEGSMSLKDLPKEASSLEEFLDSLPALDTPLKKGLFLMGALTERLLSVQGKERGGNKPFLKALKSLKMTERDLKGLLPRVRNKLEEYDRFGKGESILYMKASEYLAQAPPSWRMSVDELNFYFALGMGMFDRLAKFIYEKEEGEG